VAPAVRYAPSGDLSIAYRVVGEGPVDLIWVPGFVSHVEVLWELPLWRRMIDRLTAFARVIVFDKREQGLSDRTGAPPTLEDIAGDLGAVLDAVGSERAALIGLSEGGPAAALFAASHPERVRALVLVGTYGRLTQSPDNPNGVPQEVFDQMGAGMKKDHHAFFRGFFKDFFGAGKVSDAVLDHAQHQMSMASVHNILKAAEAFSTTDFRPDLASFGDTPTLIIHGDADQTVPIDLTARVVKTALPHARLIEYKGSAHGLFESDKERLIADLVEFLTAADGSRSETKAPAAEAAA